MKALVGGKIYTVTKGIIEEGAVLLNEGRIAAVGKNIEIPAGAEIIDCRGCQIMPGIIDAHTHLGISEEGIGEEGWDYNEEADPVTPAMRAIDGFNPQELGVADALRGGVTTVMVAPGSANVVGGQVAVVKTAGSWLDEMLVNGYAGMKVAFGENPKRVYGEQKKSPITRMGTAALLRECLIDAENYRRKKAKDDNWEMDEGMEAMLLVLERKVPLRAHAHRADDMLTAIRIAEEFNLRLVLDHGTEGQKIADILAEKNIPVVFGPLMTSRSKIELKDRFDSTPAVLAQAGVKVAFCTDHPVLPIQYLNIGAGVAMREGLSEEDTFKALTINAAEILGVADRLGSIEAGKDGDLVVYDGYPLEVASKVVRVMVNGETAFERGEK